MWQRGMSKLVLRNQYGEYGRFIREENNACTN